MVTNVICDSLDRKWCPDDCVHKSPHEVATVSNTSHKFPCTRTSPCYEIGAPCKCVPIICDPFLYDLWERSAPFHRRYNHG